MAQIEIRFVNSTNFDQFDQIGFNVDLQLVRFEKVSSFQSRELATNQVMEDIVGFYYEYIAQKKALPISVLLENDKFYSPSYQAYFTDLVDDNERDGSLIFALEACENALSKAPIGSIVFFTSPPGRTNMYMKDGSEIVFPQTQTYVYQKVSKNDVIGTTIVSSMTLGDNSAFLTEAHRIGAIAVNPNLISRSAESYLTSQAMLLLPHQTGLQRNIFEVVDLMREFISTEQFDEIVWEIKNHSESLAINQEIEFLLLDLNHFLLSSDYDEHLFKLKLQDVLLKINYYQNLSMQNGEMVVNLQKSLCNLALKAGCNGGGVSRSVLGARKFGTEKNLVVTCPFCYHKVKAVISNGRIKCPSCERTAPYRC